MVMVTIGDCGGADKKKPTRATNWSMPWLSCLCNHQFGVGDRRWLIGDRRWLRGCHFGIHNSDIPSDGILHAKTVLRNIGLRTEFPLTAWSAAGHSFILREQTVLRNPGVCAQRRGLDGSSARAASASRAFKSVTIVGSIVGLSSCWQ